MAFNLNLLLHHFFTLERIANISNDSGKGNQALSVQKTVKFTITTFLNLT